MRKNKDHQSKSRFITMVLWRYVIFSVVLFLLLAVVFFAALWNSGRYSNVPYIRELTAEFDGKAPSEYEAIDTEKRLGEKGYVQVLDENNTVIFSNERDRIGETYTDYELDYIPDYNDHSIVTVERFPGRDGEERVITTSVYDKDGSELKNAVYVVDDDLNVLYSSEFKDKKKLTKREYDLVTRNSSSRYVLSKGSFTDDQGQRRTLLAYSPKNFKSNFNRIKEAFLNLIMIFFSIYALLIVLFSLWISMKVKKPLKLLNTAMRDITEENRGTQLQYKGSREFVELCENFNGMSRKLYLADQENQRLQREQQKMIADISHDLKTPITVIKGYAGAICDGVVTPEEQKTYLQSIYKKSEVLAELIDEFHEFSKLQHPESQYLFVRTDICEFTRKYFAESYGQFELNGFMLDADIPERPVYAELDVKKFKRVYDNILGNFFRYNQPGRTFFCRVEELSGRVRIILGDNGRGIPEAIRSTLFDPFVVGEKARTSSGSGLGLSIARRITEGHGGTLSLQVPPEEGLATEFVIEL